MTKLKNTNQANSNPAPSELSAAVKTLIGKVVTNQDPKSDHSRQLALIALALYGM